MFLLPFQCQASFQSEQFGSYDYATTVAVTGRVLFVKSAVAHAHAKKTPVAITALLINLSGRNKETKAMRAIVYPFVS